MEFEFKMVVAVRKDLRLSPGKIAAQVGHACVNLAMMERNQKRKAFHAWLGEGQKKVVVKVGSLKELYALKEQAEELDLPTTLIQDAGLTEVEPGTVTCLGIGPAAGRDIDPVTGGLPLM
jgi:PTH2 family peptidyl-tRNA hydrolase